MNSIPSLRSLAKSRIAVVGCSGSGKSTLSRKIGEELSLKVVELDSIFHLPNWTSRPSDEFKAVVTELLSEAKSGWVVDGNYLGSIGDLVLQQSEVVIWFDLPRRVVMRRVIKRSFGRVILRTELWNGNREKFRSLLKVDPEQSIIRWAWTQHGSYREKFKHLSESAPANQVWIRLGSDADLKALFK